MTTAEHEDHDPADEQGDEQGDEQTDEQGDVELRAALTRVLGRLVREEPVVRRGDDLMPLLDAHLGVTADTLPVVVEPVPAHRWADTDIALATVVARDPEARLVGVGGGDQRHHSSLGDLMAHAEWGRFRTGQVDRLNVATGPDTERATVAFGMHLFHHGGSPVVVVQRAGNPQHGSEPRLEVLGAEPDAVTSLLAELREQAMRHSVLWRQVVSFSGSPYERSLSGVTFHHRPVVPAEHVVLPEGTLEQVRAHVVGLAEHRDRLLAKGQHLKRGVLLYGPPGTGKTHTVRHLVGATPDTTVVLLSGTQMVHVAAAAQIARAHQPAIVVIEDCDLIAEDRDHHYGGGPSPMLFTLLDAMDGLDADADVVFLLTTNRAEALERALAQRPGRVDLAVEVPLPDEPARRALVALYGSQVGFSPEAVARAARDSAGTTASYAKELVRRAVLLAAVDEREPGDEDLAAASAALQSDSAALTLALLGSTGPAA
ncbi:ATP-binding protein [Nocardioides deserti]|uniref:AAA family ATPase n=1 Tax=Nocardioides deserti TaxID=1588644 RepID=A0ABR6UCK8_9ACTN|nr:ATP-binding protein [Nocardioides deserti]MBC2962181.1 AAA family ATPase [Nocardioides deserti]GGO67894.1 ATPase [Nocardioides deserti]